MAKVSDLGNGWYPSIKVKKVDGLAKVLQSDGPLGDGDLGQYFAQEFTFRSNRLRTEFQFAAGNIVINTDLISDQFELIVYFGQHILVLPKVVDPQETEQAIIERRWTHNGEKVIETNDLQQIEGCGFAIRTCTITKKDPAKGEDEVDVKIDKIIVFLTDQFNFNEFADLQNHIARFWI